MESRVTKLAPQPAPEFDPASGRLLICVSAEVPDRDDEVVVPRTLRLESYQKNPVVLCVHDHRQMPVGTARVWLGEDGRLMAEFDFADTPEARTVAGLYRQGVLRGASIGFISDGTREVSPAEAFRRFGVRKRLREHTGGELLEISCVPVPSCPDALALGWIDAPAAAALVAMGGVPDLVTKGLAPFLSDRQATAGGTITPENPEAAVSQTTLKSGSESETPGAASTATVTLQAKETGTTDDTAGGSTVGTDDEVKGAFRNAAHKSVDELFDADHDDTETHKSCHRALKHAHRSYVRYCKGLGEGGEGDEGDEEDTELEGKEAGSEEIDLLGRLLDEHAADIAGLKAKAAEVDALKGKVAALEEFQGEALETFKAVYGAGNG